VQLVGVVLDGRVQVENGLFVVFWWGERTPTRREATYTTTAIVKMVPPFSLNVVKSGVPSSFG
jgi:hypothetical protein